MSTTSSPDGLASDGRERSDGPSFDELWLVVDPGHAMPADDPVHASGKRHRRRLADQATPRRVRVRRRRNQPWVPTSGLVGRKRRSARRG